MKKVVFAGKIENGKINFSDKDDSFQTWIDQWEEGTELEVSVSRKSDRRTLTQNNSIHKYFELVSEALNESGLTIEKVIENFTMEHEWSPALVKELLWREAQRFATKKESTTELNKLEDISKTYEIVNRFLAKLGLHIPFPSIATQFNKIK